MNTGKNSVGHPVDVATGEMYIDQKDISIGGKFELFWDRHYSTLLAANAESALGPGWHSTFFMTLVRTPSGYRMVNEDGGNIDFDDPNGIVANGGVLKVKSGFRELRRRGSEYVVTRWVAEQVDVELYVFTSQDKNETWRLTAIEDPTGQGLDLRYDAIGRLHRVHQRMERRVLEIDYATSGRIASISVACEGLRETLVRYEYDSRGRLARSFDALNQADSYAYDDRGLIVREIARDGGVFNFRYDEHGRCIWTAGLDNYDAKTIRYRDNIGWTEVTDSLGAVTRYQWNPNGQVILQVNQLGGQASSEFDAFGRFVARTNEIGATTKYEYNESGDCVKITDPGGATVSREFNESHLLVQLTDEAGNVWRWEHDANNRVTAQINPLGDKTAYMYDAHGNVVELVSPDGARQRQEFSPTGSLIRTSDFAGRTTRIQADALRRVVVETNPVGASTQFRYDRLGRLTSVLYPNGGRKAWEYSPVGLVTSVTDELNRVTRFRFGPCRRLVERVDALGNSVKYRWGSEPGRLEAIINEKGDVYSFDYDAVGRVFHERSFDGREMWFEYDLAGNIVASRTDDVHVTRYEQNPVGLVSKVTFPDGVVHQFDYDPLGNILKAENPDCTVEFARDPLGNILKTTQGKFEIETPEDSDPSIQRVKTSLGLDAAFGYDPNGELREVAVNGRQVIRCHRDAADRETAVLFAGRIGLQKSYDIVGNLAEQQVLRGVQLAALAPTSSAAPFSIPISTVLWRSFDNDLTGNLTAMRDSQRGETRFEYDAGDRVRRAVRDHGASEAYDFDACDNVTQMSQGAKQQALTYAPGNRLVDCSETSYVYDELGRLVSKRIVDGSDGVREWRFTWDWLDRLRTAITPDGAIWKYRYDTFGRRIAKEGPDDLYEFLWDGDKVIQVVHNGRVASTWLFATNEPRQPLLGIVNNEPHLVVTDHIGTPRELVDTQGNVAWAASHTVWGEVVDETPGAASCPLRFPGQWFDAETGLHYNYFRYYDPDIGRYITPDPLGPDGGNNLFAYVANPLNWVDIYGWHGNDASNTNPQHVYEIKDNQTGETFKYGISGKPLNQDGSSPRANIQKNKLNNEPSFAKKMTGEATEKRFLPKEQGGGGEERFTAKIVKKNITSDATGKARQKALDLEQKKVDAFAKKSGGKGPPGNKRPQPTPSTGCKK